MSSSSRRVYLHGEHKFQVPEGFVLIITESGMCGEKSYYTGYLVPRSEAGLDRFTESYTSPFDGQIK